MQPPPLPASAACTCLSTCTPQQTPQIWGTCPEILLKGRQHSHSSGFLGTGHWPACLAVLTFEPYDAFLTLDIRTAMQLVMHAGVTSLTQHVAWTC